MNPLLIVSPYEADAGALIGRDPRTLTAAEFDEYLPDALTGLRAIRAKCLDCNHTYSEVLKCTATQCPLWPLRMGVKPKGMREARGEVMDRKGGFPK